MQSNYERAESSSDLPDAQHLTDSCCEYSCSPPFFPHNILPPVNPSMQINQHFSLLHHQQGLLNITAQQQYYSDIAQQHQYNSHTNPIFTHQFFQEWPVQFQPWQAQRRETPADQSSHSNDLFPVMNFKLGGNYLLDALPENRPYSLEFTPKFCRQTQEYSTAKQPFCKDIHDIPNADKKNNQFGDVREICNELEEIYGLVKNSTSKQLTGTGSALTREANLDPAPFCQEEETSPKIELHKKKKRRRKSSKELLSSMAGFFEGLVEQVMSHQDRLHSNFLEAIDRIDRERREREEEWRRQEAQTQNREAMARVHEQVLASSREALIVSYLEKITGQTVDLPSGFKNSPDALIISELSNLEEMSDISKSAEKNMRRWPRSEVEALIRVRSGLGEKFHQEPGINIKGPIWEDVSALMASMGYKRSAKRCKEKWENINKYFRSKTKNNYSATNKVSKTCSYFDQLDQLYARVNTPKMFNVGPSSSSSISPYCAKPLVDGFGAQSQRQSYIELMETFGVAEPSSSGNLDFDGVDFHDKVEFERVDRDAEKLNHMDEDDEVFEDEIEEEDDPDDEE